MRTVSEVIGALVAFRDQFGNLPVVMQFPDGFGTPYLYTNPTVELSRTDPRGTDYVAAIGRGDGSEMLDPVTGKPTAEIPGYPPTGRHQGPRLWCGCESAAVAAGAGHRPDCPAARANREGRK